MSQEEQEKQDNDELSLLLQKIRNDETKEINITNETKELRPSIFSG